MNIKLFQNMRAGSLCLVMVFIAVCAGLPVWAETAGRAEAQQGHVMFLARAVEIALENNPDIRALESRYQAVTNIPPQAGSLPDPVLSFNALNIPTDSFSLDQEPMTQMQVKFVQAIPFPGKLSMKEIAASRDADSLKYQLEELRLGIALQVEKTWWDIFYLEKFLGIVRKNRVLIQDMVDTARAKYEAGQGMQQDVLLAQVELSDLLNTEADLEGKIEDAKARLARLAGNGVDSSFVIPLADDVSLPAPQTEQSNLEVAMAMRPVLKAVDSKIEASEARLDLSEKGYFPDFALGAAYGFRQDGPDGMDRPDFASFMISINIPVWAGSKQSREIARRSLEVQEKKELLRSSRQKVRQEIASAIADLTSMRRQAVFYRDAVIPQARLTLSSMISAYQVNRVDFLNVIRARLAILRYEKMYWRALTGAKKADARLRAARGEVVQPAEASTLNSHDNNTEGSM